jgi:dihydroorotate dehydrogenase
MSRLFGLARPLLMAMDPERAHRLGIALARRLPLAAPPVDDPALAVSAFGLRFANPVGLAAGFDKNGEALDRLFRFGFGSIEIGGVTPRPQAGNALPRVFRLPADRAVINRYGLNNDGMHAVAERLAQRGQALGPLGINLGPNKDSVDRVGDFVTLIKCLQDQANYLSINISSPNTPGLRDLQEADALDQLLARTREASRKPLLVKIAPDLDLAALDAIIAVALKRSMDGLIVANTTLARPATLRSPARSASEQGGLSGVPLFKPSTRLLAQCSLRLAGRMPLIGVGGIASAKDAITKIQAGATLIQLYTALIYQGPGLIGVIKRGIAEHLRQEGCDLAQMIGAKAQAIAAETP